MPQTASELKVVTVSRKDSRERREVKAKMFMDGHAIDKEGNVYPLEQNVVKSAPAKMTWERVDVLGCVGLGEYLDAERFCLLLVKRSRLLHQHQGGDQVDCKLWVKSKVVEMGAATEAGIKNCDGPAVCS